MKLKFYLLSKLLLLTIIFFVNVNITFSQTTQYVEEFNDANVPAEWASVAGFTNSIVTDVDPYSGSTLSVLQMAVSKTSTGANFRLSFPSTLDLTNNKFITIKLRNPDAISGMEIRLIDSKNASWSYSNVVLTAGYNELYFVANGTLDFTKIVRMEIRPSTFTQHTVYNGNIFIDYIKIGNNDIFPFEKAELYNAFVRDGFNATSLAIDTVANSFLMKYAGPTDASNVQLYVATSNAASWETNAPTSRRNFDAGFTAKLVSLQGTLSSNYSFKAERIDANLRKNISQLLRGIDNANYSNIELDPHNKQIMAKVHEIVGGTLAGSTVTTPEGVKIAMHSSTHPNIAVSGLVSYPQNDPVYGEFVLALTENGYTEQLPLDVYILPELIKGIHIPSLYSGIADRTIPIPVEDLLNDSTLFSDQLSFTYNVLDTTLLSGITDSYESGDKTLLLSFKVKNPGPAIVNINIYNNGSLVKTVKLGVSVFSPVTPENKGVVYKATDVAQWQARPYKTNPTNKPGFPIILNETFLVKSGLDFFHGIMSGILIPPRSGNYQFQITGDGEGNQTLWLAEGVNVSALPNESNPESPVNHVAKLGSNGTRYLKAGVPYYFEAHHKQIVNSYEVKLAWKKPGDLDFTYIPDNFVVQYVDFVLPSVVTGISSIPGEKVSLLRWNKATDDQGLEGYNVYVNGRKVNQAVITKEEYLLAGLTKETAYEVVVASVDAFGNQSLPSAIHRFNTTSETTDPAQLPASINADVITAFRAAFSWNQAPGALGYNIYLDGVKLNDNFLTDTAYSIEGLLPEKSYQVAVKTLNVSFVESTESKTFSFTTLAFDINNPNEKIYTAEVAVSLNTVAKATGLGLHIDHGKDKMIAAEKAKFDELMAEFQPAGLRFGAIEANSVNYKDVSGTGAKYVTFGQFAASSLQHGGKYVMLCTGPGPNTDYTQAPAETFKKLLEYLAGNSNTTEGAKRAAEGYAQPFTSQMDAIIIELGNEVWGGEAHQVPNHAYDYVTYLAWVKEVTKAVLESPYYDPKKIYLSVSARSPQFPEYQDRIFDALKGEFPYLLSLSGYVGGNIMDTGEDFSDIVSSSRLAYHKQSYDRMAYYLSNMDKINRNAIAKTGRIWPFFPYESNSTQQNYHGSLGQALLCVDYFHEYVKKGAVIPTVFNLDGGQWRIVTKQQDGSYLKRPLFHLAAISNQTTRGGVLLESSTKSAKKLTNHYAQEYEFSPVGFHAFNRNDEYTLMLFSREFEHDYKIKLSLPDVGPISNGKIKVITGESFSAENLIITETNITVEDGMLVDVPKYSMVVITFNATDFGLTAPFLNDDFVQVNKVNIQTGDGSIVIDDNKAYLAITTNVEPDSAFVTGTQIVIIDTDSTGATLKGNLLYPGTKNGTVKVYARALSDTTVISDTLTITIDKSNFQVKPTIALKVNVPPTITGVLDESWSLAPAVPLTNVVIGQVTPQSLSANFRTLWDQNNLYIHIEVTDDFVRTDANATSPWEWDGVEVFIDALNKKNSTYIQGNDAQYASAVLHNFDQLWKTWHASKEGVIVHDLITEKGYNKVLVFPLATIKVPTDSLPHSMGFDVQVNDNDAGSGRENKITWSATQDNAWNNPQAFGTLVLDEYRALAGLSLQGSNTIMLNADENYRAIVDFAPSNATFTGVIWTSNNPMVATVSSSGNIIAMNEGVAYIKVTSFEGGFADSLLIEVTKPVTGIQLLAADTIINIGASIKLDASVVPSDAFIKDINWTSSDTTVAIVDSTGLVQAITVGTATITATTAHRGFSQSIQVQVKKPVTGVAFKVVNLAMDINGQVDLLPLVTVLPADATITDLIWETDASHIVSVSEGGELTAKANGRANIKVTTVDGGYAATLAVISGTLPVGEDAKKGRINREYWTNVFGPLIWSLTTNPRYPNEPTGKDFLTQLEAVSWVDGSDNNTWADNYGQRILGYLHPEVSGNYVFFISGDDQCELYISADDMPANKTKIASVGAFTGFRQWNRFSSQKSLPVYLEKGKKYYIEVLHKEGFSSDHVSVGWLKPGETGNLPSEVVPGKVLSPFSDASSINVAIAVSMDIGQQLQLSAIIEPYTMMDNSVTWASSNPNIVSITENGTITALGQGQVTIIVQTNTGGITDELNIIVKVSNKLYTSRIGESVMEDVKFNIFPNPAVDFFIINIPKKDELSTLTLVNSQGVILKHLQINKDVTEVNFDTKGLEDGVYILFIKSGNQSQQRKLMVKH